MHKPKTPPHNFYAEFLANLDRVSREDSVYSTYASKTITVDGDTFTLEPATVAEAWQRISDNAIAAHWGVWN